MNIKKIYSLLLGVLITSVLSGVVYYVMYYEYLFHLYSFDGEIIANAEEREGIIFYTALITTLIFFIFSLVLFLSNKRFMSLGALIPTTYSIWLLISIGAIYLDKSNYYEPFDKQVWMQSDIKPLNMARWFIKTKELHGLTREKTILKLGAPGETEFKTNDSIINYNIDHTYAVFMIRFEDNKVNQVYIFLD
jgi:hypothetical protein